MSEYSLSNPRNKAYWAQSTTVVEYFKMFHYSISGNLKKNDTIIDDERVIVQIDKCDVGKQKYNGSHTVDGVQIVGGV